MRTLAIAALLLPMLAVEASAQRSCHVVRCQQVRADEVCVVTPCSQPGRTMRWYRGHYAVGDGNVGVYRGGTHDQCANRCASNSRCIIAEYYFGNEGIKCNLYSYLPEVRWNTSQDAIIGVWE